MDFGNEKGVWKKFLLLLFSMWSSWLGQDRGGTGVETGGNIAVE